MTDEEIVRDIASVAFDLSVKTDMSTTWACRLATRRWLLDRAREDSLAAISLSERVLALRVAIERKFIYTRLTSDMKSGL